MSRNVFRLIQTSWSNFARCKQWKEVGIMIEDKVEHRTLTQEELEKYVNDPKWVSRRWWIFILFWIMCLGLLTKAIMIVAFTETNTCKHKRENNVLFHDWFLINMNRNCFVLWIYLSNLFIVKEHWLFGFGIRYKRDWKNK